MKGKVFLLEDDGSIRGLVKVALEMNGTEVAVFSSLKDFTAALENDLPDVALLDIMLPDGNGLEALKYVKEKNPETACIMLTALGKEADKVTGLNMGADDYIVKPFSVLELTARVNACLRRVKRPESLTVGELVLEETTLTVTLSGESLALNRKEFELLKYFMENAGKVLTREKLLTAVWGYESGETRTLDNHVARLRKLGVKIETVFGVGYKL